MRYYRHLLRWLFVWGIENGEGEGRKANARCVVIREISGRPYHRVQPSKCTMAWHGYKLWKVAIPITPFSLGSGMGMDHSAQPDGVLDDKAGGV